MSFLNWLFTPLISEDKPTSAQAAPIKNKPGRPRTTPITSIEKEAACADVTPKINKPANHRDIYIDGEWNSDTKPQKFYLLGYCFDDKHFGWLYDENDYTYNGKTYYKPPKKGKNLITKKHILELFKGVENIYFYGPDIGMLEKCFNINLHKNHNCINLLRAVRRLEPNAPNFKLVTFEEMAGIHRETKEYKGDIWNLHRDWYSDPIKRARALLYNKEDVINLMKVKKYLYKKHNVTKEIEKQFFI